MRLFDWKEDNERERNDRSIDLKHSSWSFDHSQRIDVEYNNSTFNCSWTTSPDNEWTVAFGRTSGPENCRMFASHDDEIIYTRSFERPLEAQIANDGTSVLIDGGSSTENGGIVAIMDPKGEIRFHDSFDSNVNSASISSNGSLVAVATLNPDCCVYVYETRTEERLRHQILHGRRHNVFIDESENHIHIIDNTGDKHLYTIDRNGETVWRSERIQSQDSIFDRLLNQIRS